jgi:ribosomal protein L33
MPYQSVSEMVASTICQEDRWTKRRNKMTTTKRGIEVLHNPALNKSTAFTEAEKQSLGIIGLGRVHTSEVLR